MCNGHMVIAAKCAPKAGLLRAVQAAGILGLELYTSGRWLDQVQEIIRLCQDFQFTYALHAPTDDFRPAELAELASGINTRIVIFHNIFWEDEWVTIRKAFDGLDAVLCLENVATIHEPLKFMRRFNMGCCLDLEHLQMEVGGVYEGEFLRVMKSASHVHMTGFSFGSDRWHSHLHHAPEHAGYLLGLLARAGYSGMVVSEARVSYQTLAEFSRLAAFAERWATENRKAAGTPPAWGPEQKR